MSPTSNFKAFGLAAAMIVAPTAFAPGAFAQTGDQPLPSAPSAVLAAQQNESLAHPAGSDAVFKPGSVTPGPVGTRIEAPQDGILRLSLDDAISYGLQRNVRLIYDRANQKAVKGDTSSVIAALLPNVNFNADAEAQEINLAALGFKPSLLSKFSATGLLPPGTTIATIVKVNTVQAQFSANQQLFNLPDFQIYRATKNEVALVDLNLLSDRGDLVLSTGMSYLQVLAEQSNLTNAQAQVRSAQTVLNQATARHDAGVGVNLDVLRAKVDLQQRQQDVIAAQTQLDKDTIQLARIIGIPAGQKLELTDTAPFAPVEGMDLDTAKVTAYAHRKDLLALDQQVQVAVRELKAVKYQRLPTLAFNGSYGVLGAIGGLYHGVFNATGTLSVPIFREAAQRGEEQVIDSQLTSLHQREADLRVTVDAQIRSAILDVTAAKELVDVSKSNVQLAQQELADAKDRFAAGVDDNLPVVDAEAAVASAEAQLVQSLYQYNVAKLQLARSTGVVETRYRTYLGK
jgi:outer membrane protein TolC